MALRCPYCSHALNPRAARPGRYTPKCPKCQRAFALTVGDGPEPALTAEPLPGPADATGVFTEPPAGDPTGVFEQAATETDRAGVPRAEPPDHTAMLPDDHPAAARAASSAKTGAGGKDATVHGLSFVQDDVTPSRLGGYQIVKELGRGGMGAVYLARQLSLDRPVALKVMNAVLASDPVFVARFTREAFAAAQLVHHNVVQIYDIGSDAGFQFFSMEFVEGESLADLVKRQGKLTPELAIGYTLQAARGLKFGHDRGMIHRDVKPDNLLLNKHGVVKVADLGLVKTPAANGEPVTRDSELKARGGEIGLGSAFRSSSKLAELSVHTTNVNVAMGTPAYMSPEQCRDAARVDARADVYSLGCTLYVLLTGRPPFSGTTAFEVMTKHATEPMVPPDAVVPRVPRDVSAVVLKMTAKRADDRHADMGAVIADLEKWLGVQPSGPFSPREEHLAELEECVRLYADAPAGRRRRVVLSALWAADAALVAVFLLAGQLFAAATFLGVGVLAAVVYFVARGIAEREFLFRKARGYALGASPLDWLRAAGVGLFAVLVLYLSGMLLPWLVAAAVSAAVALGVRRVLDRPLAAQRAVSLDRAEELFRDLRLRGLEEDALRQFVWRFGGPRAEEFFEALFGYEAKVAARAWTVAGEERNPRVRHAPWRDGVVRWIDERQAARRAARERRHLRAVEEGMLKSRGLSAADARRQAEDAADAMLEQAALMKELEARTVAGQAGRRADVRELAEAAERKRPARRLPRPPAWKRVLKVAAGPGPRLVVGTLLVLGCLAWANRNGLVPSGLAAPAGDVAKAKPFKVPALPLTFDGFNPGVAGLILVLAALVSYGAVSVAFLWAAAAVAFFGPAVGLPGVGPVTPQLLSAGLGLAVAAVGWALRRR